MSLQASRKSHIGTARCGQIRSPSPVCRASATLQQTWNQLLRFGVSRCLQRWLCAMIRVTRFRRRRHWMPTATQWWVGPPDPNLRHQKNNWSAVLFAKNRIKSDKPCKTGRCLRKRHSGGWLWLLGHDCQERGYLMLKTPIFESPTWPTLLRPWKFWTGLHWQRR